jgi:hypothetical protein
MPGRPFATPVTDRELWANLLSDLGVNPILGTAGSPTTWREILLLLGQGLNNASSASFGNGADGKVTFDGTTTVLGLAPSSSIYTLTRDIYLTDGSSVSAGAVIETAGFRIFCIGNLLVNGTIRTTANAAVTSTIGALLSYSGTISNTTVGTAGGASSTTTTGGAGVAASTNALGGVGGTGGTEGGGAGTPGVGGAVTAPVATVQNLNALAGAQMVRVVGTTALALCMGGSGGGGGAGDGTNASGAGGGGAGIVAIYANTISGTGTISAIGGAGGAASSTGNSGGGGGGGGGCIILVAMSVTTVPPTITAGVTKVNGVTLSVAGGAGGAGHGTGAAGAAGAAGTMVLLSN